MNSTTSMPTLAPHIGITIIADDFDARMDSDKPPKIVHFYSDKPKVSESASSDTTNDKQRSQTKSDKLNQSKSLDKTSHKQKTKISCFSFKKPKPTKPKSSNSTASSTTITQSTSLSDETLKGPADVSYPIMPVDVHSSSGQSNKLYSRVLRLLRQLARSPSKQDSQKKFVYFQFCAV
jgi:hypothetical protein